MASRSAWQALAYNPGVPETSSFVSRPGDDRCPGVLRLVEAADGFLARVRLPGGLVSGEQLRVLTSLADELGDGRVELTSRGNVQLRGLAADAAEALTDGLTRAGLLPSLSHDRVRNVLASPLAGLDGGPDLSGIVRALDAALCERPRLAELSGRFMFAVDDGRGDVSGLGADVVATLYRDSAVTNGSVVDDGVTKDGVANGGVTNGSAVNGAVNAAVVNGLLVRRPADPDQDAPGHGSRAVRTGSATAGRGEAGGAGRESGLGAVAEAALHWDSVGADGPSARRRVDHELPERGAGAHVPGSHGVPGDLRDAIVEAMLACAEAFLDLRVGCDATAWRIADLPDGAARVRAAVAERLGLGVIGREQPSHADLADEPGLADKARHENRSVTAERPGLDAAGWQEPSRADAADRPDAPGRAPCGNGAGPAQRGMSLTAMPGGDKRSAATAQSDIVPTSRQELETGTPQVIRSAPDAAPAGRRGPGPVLVSRPVGLVTGGETVRGGESAASVLGDRGESVVVIAPLGRLTSAQLGWVADRLGGGVARVTPWRSVVLPGVADAAGVLREATGLGFGTDAGSPWLRVTACAGRPGCAKALADVQADAAGFAARWPGRIVHVSGCARHCGRPAATEVDVTATSEGYQVAGV